MINTYVLKVGDGLCGFVQNTFSHFKTLWYVEWMDGLGIRFCISDALVAFPPDMGVQNGFVT